MEHLIDYKFIPTKRKIINNQLSNYNYNKIHILINKYCIIVILSLMMIFYINITMVDNTR